MTIQDIVADRQALFSATANFMKRSLDRARFACFGLSIVGATLAAIAGGLQSDAYRSYLAWPAAAMLAIGAFMALRLLSRDFVALYVKARLASEVLKREAFLYATSAPPYDDINNRNHEFAHVLDTVEKNADGVGFHEQKSAGPGSCPRGPLDSNAYITSRLNGQIDFYRNTADRLSMPSRFLHGAEFVLTGAAAAITAIAATLGKSSFDMAALTAVITTLAGTVLSHLQASRYDDRIVIYRATAHRLASLEVTMPNASAADIAAAAEEIIATETNSWQATWLK